MVTRGINESHIPDGRISVYGIDASMTHPVFGLLAIGGSHIDAQERLPAARPADVRRRGPGADRALAGRRHAGHRPGQRRGDQLQRQPGPILALAAAVRRQRTGPADQRGRGRRQLAHQRALCGDACPTASTAASATSSARRAVRVPAVHGGGRARRSRGAELQGLERERSTSLAARLVFKTDWQSRESIMLLYASWFYGTDTHPEDSSSVNAPAPSPRRPADRGQRQHVVVNPCIVSIER